MIRKAIIVVLTLAAVGISTLWIRSCNGRDVGIELTGRSDWHAIVACGVTGSHQCTFLSCDPRRGSLPKPDPEYRLLGFTVQRIPNWGQQAFLLDFPIWAPLVLLLTYPAIAFIRGPLRRYRRRRKGLCIACGYNLTGDVSGVCSECGTPIGGEINGDGTPMNTPPRKRMWFTAKTNGIGWRRPTCWQGWAVFLGYWAVLVVGYFELLVFHQASVLWWLLLLVGATGSLTWVCWMKGPPPRWRRGDDTGDYPPGHCPTCGYDLTGNVSGVCPECGTEIA